MKMILPKCDCKFGAPMGRRNNLPPERLTAAPKLRMVRLRWVDGDYDQGGAYWGGNVRAEINGKPIGKLTHIYWAQGEAPGVDEQFRVFVRAGDREQAKAEVRSLIPNARFYR